MKKHIQQEVEVCDFCQVVAAWEHCLCCGKAVCRDCKSDSSVGIGYSHAIYGSGSGDGWYCQACHTRLGKEKDPMLRAYRNIAALRTELKLWSADFEERQIAAEKELVRLQRGTAK